jgi:hypothetical protein
MMTPRRSVVSLLGEMREPPNVADYVLLAIGGLVVAYGVWMIFSGP